MHHLKRLWGYYLALILLIATLAFPIYWVYKFFQYKFGSEAALIALTLTIMTIMIFVVQGAVHTHRLVRELKQNIEKQSQTDQNPDLPTPLLFKLFKIDPSPGKCTKPADKNSHGTIESSKLFPPSPHRGKPPRFPKEQIRKAVMKWERRDPSITALTLEQFLAQEFGSSPDGVLLMAVTTFYDWRRRILKEIEEDKHQR